MNKSRIYSLSALALILASIGAVSAMWYQSIGIDVTIHTGRVAVIWDGWSCNDEGADPQIPNTSFDNSEGKDVATCSISSLETNDDGTVTLNVTITNAYPGYFANLSLLVKNVGTIPVKLVNSSIQGADSNALMVDLQTPGSTQIHPDETGQYYLNIGVLQTAQQSSTYSFTVTLMFAQWNEVTGP